MATTFQEDFRTLILGTTTVSGKVATSNCHYNKVPQEISPDTGHIWFQPSSEEDEMCFDGASGLRPVRVAVECIVANNPSATIALGEAVRDRLHGFKGTFGSTSRRALGIFVENQDDDYIPRLEGSDDGTDVIALDVLVMHTT